MGAQKAVGVRDGTDEHASRFQVPHHVLQHHADLGFGFEGVVHAELHRHDVEWPGHEHGREDLFDGVLQEQGKADTTGSTYPRSNPPGDRKQALTS